MFQQQVLLVVAKLLPMLLRSPLFPLPRQVRGLINPPKNPAMSQQRSLAMSQQKCLVMVSLLLDLYSFHPYPFFLLEPSKRPTNEPTKRPSHEPTKVPSQGIAFIRLYSFHPYSFY